MVTETENKLLTEVGPKTPMGRLMREYWIPVLRSVELEPGAAPLRIKRLGEYFVAFRSPGGEVGVMDEACPHRGASMALARNEDCGLRCVYHGWKIDAAGDVVEAPTHPENADLRKLKTRSHPVRESQGVIWSWLGKGEAPPFPKLAFTGLPDDHVTSMTAVINCGWLRPLETLWDVFHSQILHNQTNRASDRADVYFSKDANRKAGELVFDYPEMLVRRTPYGFSYTNVDGMKETNFEFIAPFALSNTVTPPATDDKLMQIVVPIDDDHTLDWLIFYNRFAPLKPDGLGMRALGGVADPNNYLGDKGDRTPENRWGQDRDAMDRGESFNGVTGFGSMTIMAEDVLVIESQGDGDRSQENLGPVDRALVAGRRVLLDALAAYERGEPPIGRGLDLTDVEALYVVKQIAAE